MEAAKLVDLLKPFPIESVKFKPGSVSNDGRTAMAMAFINARDVCERLDEVCGPGGWRDEYRDVDADTVECTLFILVDGQWIGKKDVGGRSAQKSQSDRTKSAYSDALKRAGAKWGIGRYLYRIPRQWVEYDSKRRQFVKPPSIPREFIPGGSGKPSPASKQGPAVSVDPVASILIDATKNIPTNGSAYGLWTRAVTKRLAAAGYGDEVDLLEVLTAELGGIFGDTPVDDWTETDVAMACGVAFAFISGFYPRTDEQSKRINTLAKAAKLGVEEVFGIVNKQPADQLTRRDAIAIIDELESTQTQS